MICGTYSTLKHLEMECTGQVPDRAWSPHQIPGKQIEICNITSTKSLPLIPTVTSVQRTVWSNCSRLMSDRCFSVSSLVGHTPCPVLQWISAVATLFQRPSISGSALLKAVEGEVNMLRREVPLSVTAAPTIPFLYDYKNFLQGTRDSKIRGRK